MSRLIGENKRLVGLGALILLGTAALGLGLEFGVGVPAQFMGLNAGLQSFVLALAITVAYAAVAVSAVQISKRRKGSSSSKTSANSRQSSTRRSQDARLRGVPRAPKRALGAGDPEPEAEPASAPAQSFEDASIPKAEDPMNYIDKNLRNNPNMNPPDMKNRLLGNLVLLIQRRPELGVEFFQALVAQMNILLCQKRNEKAFVNVAYIGDYTSINVLHGLMHLFMKTRNFAQEQDPKIKIKNQQIFDICRKLIKDAIAGMTTGQLRMLIINFTFCEVEWSDRLECRMALAPAMHLHFKGRAILENPHIRAELRRTHNSIGTTKRALITEAQEYYHTHVFQPLYNQLLRAVPAQANGAAQAEQPAPGWCSLPKDVRRLILYQAKPKCMDQDFWDRHYKPRNQGSVTVGRGVQLKVDSKSEAGASPMPAAPSATRSRKLAS